MKPYTPTHFGTITQALHWATALLVLIAFIYGPGGSEERIFSSARDLDRHIHETLGLSVLALTTLRILWRPFDRQPEAPHASRWMRTAATAVQAMLYVLLFALPMTAIAGSWLEGHPLTLLGGVEIAPLVGKSHALGATIATIHTWLGDSIMWLAGLHALAALYHHYVLRDEVLASMLPRRLSIWRPRRE